MEFDECVELILALLGANPATIVTDAVYECDPAERYKLLMTLDEILQELANIARVFASSRVARDIVDWLASSPNLYVSARDNSKGIEHFVGSEVVKAIKGKSSFAVMSPIL